MVSQCTVYTVKSVDLEIVHHLFLIITVYFVFSEWPFACRVEVQPLAVKSWNIFSLSSVSASGVVIAAK